MRNFDPLGSWVFVLGLWFHIVARLIQKNPSIAFPLCEFIAIMTILVGGYRILNKFEKKLEKEEETDES